MNPASCVVLEAGECSLLKRVVYACPFSGVKFKEDEETPRTSVSWPWASR